MARAAQVCLELHCPHPAAYRGRCRGHALEHDRHQKRTVPTKIAAQDPRERRRREAAVRNWVRRYGWVCPGWGAPAHQSTDLTAQHATALVLGGDHEQKLMVLCRACNSRHGVAARRRMEALH